MPRPVQVLAGAVKGAIKWMIEWPNIVSGLVGISAYARMALKGGTHCLVCVQLTFKTGVLGH